jgi:hypothetical protein
MNFAVWAIIPIYCASISFFGFSWFDDEGILLSGFILKNNENRLYDDIYSFYGPFYYEFYEFLYWIFGSLTHNAVRAASALMLGLCAATAAGVAWGLTRSHATAAITAVFVVVAMAVMSESAGHPEGLSMLLAFAMLLAAQRFERSRSRIHPVLIGSVIAAALAVKVNVGLFLGAAWAIVVWRSVAQPSWLARLGGPVAFLVLIAPVAIMWPLMGFTWVRGYAAFATLVIAAAVATWWRTDVARALTGRDLLGTIAGFLLALTAIMGATLADGTSLPALLEMTLFQTTRFVRNWYIAAGIDSAAWVMLLVSGAGTVFCLSVPVAAHGLGRVSAWVADGLRTLLIVIYAACFGVLLFPFYSPFGYFGGMGFWLVAPFATTALLPRRDGPLEQPLTRGALAMLCAIMVLYPFPVAGHQVAIASAPFAILAALALHDLSRQHAPARVERHPFRERLPDAALLIVLALLTSGTARSVHRYMVSEALDLPGAGLIRVEPGVAPILRSVTERLRACGSSYSLPGLMSFHIWAGHTPPTSLNINHPLAFLTDRQQEQVVASLAGAHDLCVIYAPRFLAFLDRGQIANRPPLLRYVQESFVPIAEIGPYHILRRRSDRDSP